MTVAELIELLQLYPQDMRVFVDDWETFMVSSGEDEDGECVVLEPGPEQ
jgi:hypothetical protein